MEILVAVSIASLANCIFSMIYGIFLSDLLIVHNFSFYLFHIEQDMNKASDPTISERTAMIVVTIHFQSNGFLNNGFSHR